MFFQIQLQLMTTESWSKDVFIEQTINPNGNMVLTEMFSKKIKHTVQNISSWTEVDDLHTSYVTMCA